MKLQCPKCKEENRLFLKERGIVNNCGVEQTKSGKILVSYVETEYGGAKYSLICDCGHEFPVEYEDLIFE